MNIIKAILFNSPGDSTLLGFPIRFKINANNSGLTDISNLGLINRTVMKIIQRHDLFNTICHEMGHALAFKSITRKNSEITVRLPNNTTMSGGSTKTPGISLLPAWQKTIITTAGPIGNAISVAAQTAIMLRLTRKNALSRSIVLAILIIMMRPELEREIRDSLPPTSMEENSDFGSIRKLGTPHLACARAALYGTSLLTAIMFLKGCYTLGQMGRNP